LHTSELKSIIEYLKGFTTQEMINRFDIKSDRADVIIPGGSIYLRAMEMANIEEMIVPKVGLADGLIRRIYLEKKADQNG
jgi:exopolyphosphatase/guanosine-5'-triphosphate,3'-diphosphate pyrophosphatase